MTTEKRKAQLREAQARLRADRVSNGWKCMWIPPSILEKVKQLLLEIENYKG